MREGGSEGARERRREDEINRNCERGRFRSASREREGGRERGKRERERDWREREGGREGGGGGNRLDGDGRMDRCTQRRKALRRATRRRPVRVLRCQVGTGGGGEGG